METTVATNSATVSVWKNITCMSPYMKLNLGKKT